VDQSRRAARDGIGGVAGGDIVGGQRLAGHAGPRCLPSQANSGL
jgi:hypothetical protein